MTRDPVAELLSVAGERPVVIADGHHRYETALHYRDERNRACEEDPPVDYVLSALFDLETERPSVLPTHRLVREGPVGDALLEKAAGWFEVERLESADDLLRRMASDQSTGGRFGVYSAGRAAVLRAIAPRRAELLGEETTEILRRLDVALLAGALERLIGLSRDSAGEQLGYTKDARSAIRSVEAGEYASAFLLDPTPVEDVAAVAEAGELMPQKSTYFYPKILTGLVFNPLEA
jgi:uncharacterized protein (DUF1015 family)